MNTTAKAKTKANKRVANLEARLAAERERRAYADQVLRYALCVLGTAKAAERYFARYERKETK